MPIQSFGKELIRLFQRLQFQALAISECKSEIDLLNIETLYFPSNSINALF